MDALADVTGGKSDNGRAAACAAAAVSRNADKGASKRPVWFWIVLPVFFFLCWLPYLITYNPGLVNYDTVNQVLDFFDGVAAVPFGYVEGQEEVTVLFNAHHPVFVTIIFGLFIKLGVALGKPALGLTIYIVCQMILAAFVFTYAYSELVEVFKVKSRGLKTAYIGFFAFCPVIPYYVCIMLKNSLHSLIMVLFVVLFLKITFGGGELCKFQKVLWVVTALLLPLTQNTGIYLVVLSLIPLVIRAVRGKKKADIRLMGGALAGVIVMMLVISKVIYPVFNIFPGGNQEMLGTLFQQTGRYVRDYGDELTEEEIATISAVVNYDVVRDGFQFETSDPIKATYNLHVTRAEVLKYIGLWVKQGFKHPDAYFRGVLPIFGQFFAFGYDFGIFDHIPTDEGIFSQINHVKEQDDYNMITAWYEWTKKFPGLDIIFQHALYTLWIPAYCIYRNKKCGRKGLVYIIPFVVNVLFVIASPMGYSRYALPLLFTSPLLLFAVIGTCHGDGSFG